MNILLVSAATPETFWSFKHVMPLISKKSAFPPLGLLTVAAMLPDKWELRLCDLNVQRLSETDIEWADYIFISAMIVQADSAREAIARCQRKNKTVVAGGPLFTTGHGQFPEVKHFVLGEAENIIDQLIEDLESGTLQHFYNDENRPDITRTPSPRWDLIDLKQYATMSLQFSRGCPYNCEFCDIIIMNGRIPRVKNPEQMIHELDTLIEAGWKGPIFIVDDNFIGNKKKVKAFLRLLVEWQKHQRPRLTLSTEASLDIAEDPELVNLMVQAGFHKIFVGIETPSKESLVECSKLQNTRCDPAAVVKYLHNTGIEVMGGFIIGFDHDQPNIFQQQLRFIQETGIVTAMVGLLNALPGTRLFSRLKEEGRLLSNTTGNNMDGMLNFIPKLDREWLINGYRNLVKHIYTPRNYYARILIFLQEYQPSGLAPRAGWAEIKAFIKSLWLIGVCSRGRREFWKFLSKVLIFHRRALPEAIQMAILGYHYRRIAALL
jgi:radical SAM superfamily enzyme YgiQ (UPF0313 family)